MKINICSLYDESLKCFLQPVFDERPTSTIKPIVSRTIISEIRREPMLVKKYKHNTFYHIGTFDDETGKIEQIEPEVIVKCDDVIAMTEGEADEL